MHDQPLIHPAVLSWREGSVPVSERFEDPYYSLHDGLAETRHVFLAGNDLPERFCDGFHVGELGIGTGLNLLALWHLWQQHAPEGTLFYTGFEAFPMGASEMKRALAPFPELAALAPALLTAWESGAAGFEAEGLVARFVMGDARTTLPAWAHAAPAPVIDAWFLDGFAPARNPELWEPDLLACVGQSTRAGGTVATYSAAGAVRRALEAAGFEITRVPGFGRKRHMTRGTRRP